MKTIMIYKREITERTCYRKFRYKSRTQYTLVYDKNTLKNHYEEIDNPRLRVKFILVLKTRSINKLEDFMNSLSKTEDDKWLKNNLLSILKEVCKNNE